MQDMTFAKALLLQNVKNWLLSLEALRLFLKQRLHLNVVGLCDMSCVMLGMKTWRLTESEDGRCAAMVDTMAVFGTLRPTFAAFTLFIERLRLDEKRHSKYLLGILHKKNVLLENSADREALSREVKWLRKQRNNLMFIKTRLK